MDQRGKTAVTGTPIHEIRENASMVEGQSGQLIHCHPMGSSGVITPARFAVGERNENHAGSVPPRVSARIGIHPQHTLQHHFQAGFFVRLTNSRLFHGFAYVHESPRQSPSRRRVAALDEYHRARLGG